MPERSGIKGWYDLDCKTELLEAVFSLSRENLEAISPHLVESRIKSCLDGMYITQEQADKALAHIKTLQKGK